MYRLIQKIKFNLRAQTAHGLHSPLVYDLYNQLLNPHLKNFEEEIFLKYLIDYIEKKDELKDSNFQIINDLNYTLSSNFKKNTILYISNPFEQETKQRMVQKIASDPRWTYLIHFFEGTILIEAPLAPRQVFYLKTMK